MVFVAFKALLFQNQLSQHLPLYFRPFPFQSIEFDGTSVTLSILVSKAPLASAYRSRSRQLLDRSIQADGGQRSPRPFERTIRGRKKTLCTSVTILGRPWFSRLRILMTLLASICFFVLFPCLSFSFVLVWPDREEVV